jgi:hypothetical protein
MALAAVQIFTLNHDGILFGVLVADTEAIVCGFLALFATPPIIKGRFGESSTGQVKHTAVRAVQVATTNCCLSCI